MTGWLVTAGASYYNLQLYRGPKKVLSLWPSRPKVQLTRTWQFNGQRYELKQGRYRWYVWPGFGSRARVRYGRAIGNSTFVVRSIP